MHLYLKTHLICYGLLNSYQSEYSYNMKYDIFTEKIFLNILKKLFVFIANIIDFNINILY